MRFALLVAWVATSGCAQLFRIDETSGPGSNTGGVDAPAGTATVTVNATGTGTITSMPAGIDCGATCEYNFPLGTSVTLTEAPINDETFTGWSGACTGTGSCTVTVSGPVSVAAAFECPTGSMTFAYTGAPVTLAQPRCVTTITVDLSGAAGGTAFYMSALSTGGMGARVQGSLALAAGSTIVVYVGGAGGNAASGTGGTGGFNGGGTGSTLAPQAGGGGGGASDIRIGGTDLTDRVFVAAGGGGAAACSAAGYIGGAGGSVSGGQSTVCGVATLATGGTQAAGGVGGGYSGYSSGLPGALGVGGAAGAGTGGGGGGGGYYGGGGGAWTGGAGGSSFAAANATSVVETPGYQSGLGSVTISY